MALTINFRNNSELFAKISGAFNDEVITPNSLLEDKTIQWEENSSAGSKNIPLYPSVDCNTAPTGTLQVRWDNTGISVTKGTSLSGLKLDVDTQFSDLNYTLEIVDEVENELCSFESFPNNPILNLSLNKN